MTRSVSDRFVHVMTEISRVFPPVNSEHPDMYENAKMAALAYAALERGISTALDICDAAEGVRMQRERRAGQGKGTDDAR